MSPWARHTGALGLVVGGVLLAHVLAASGPGSEGVSEWGGWSPSTPAPTQSAPPLGLERPSAFGWNASAWTGIAAGRKEARPAAVPTVVAGDQSGTVEASLRRGTLADSPPPPADLYAIVAAYFPEQPNFAWRVVMCESRANAAAVGDGGHARGAWQVHARYHGTVPTDFEAQTRQARAIYDEQGWGPWTCAR